MNKDINVGDSIIYNGYIPDHVGRRERENIKNSLEIGKSYKVAQITLFSDGLWYMVHNGLYPKFVPIESIDLDFNIKKKYDLR